MAGPARRPSAVPPGLNLAHAAAFSSPPSISRSTAENQPTWIWGYISRMNPGNPRIPSFLPSPARSAAPPAAAAFLPAGALPVAVRDCSVRSPNRSSPPFLFPYFSTKKHLKTARIREGNFHGDAVESGGAAAGPLAGARVHQHGERVAVERSRGSAQAHVLRAVAAASFCSSSPARRRVQPAQRRWSRGKVGFLQPGLSWE
jgi:hypothetical protein